MIRPITVGYTNNVVSFRANDTTMKDAVKVSRMLEKNGYGRPGTVYYDFLLSEIDEFKMAIANNDPENMQEELGDILFDTIMIADYHGIDPAKALAGTNKKIRSRIKKINEIAKRPITEYPLNTRLQFWKMAKAELKKEQY